MKLLRIPLLILALVGLIALAGCGGDDEESTESTAVEESTTETSEEALSVEDYTQEVQTVLVEFGTNFATLGADISASSSEEEFGTLVDEAEGEIQGVIDEFGAIQPPEEAQEGHDQILAALEDFSSKLTDVSDAASSGDDTALQDAAMELQTAALDFQDQLLAAAESLSAAGVDLEGAAAPTGG